MFDRLPWASEDDLEPTQKTVLHKVGPQVTHKMEDTPQGEKFLILDAEQEPIDSTFKAGRVEGLIQHWQQMLYGRRARVPVED
jgi:hypothetical protein